MQKNTEIAIASILILALLIVAMLSLIGYSGRAAHPTAVVSANVPNTASMPPCGTGNSCISKSEFFSLINQSAPNAGSYAAAYSPNATVMPHLNNVTAPTWAVWYTPNATGNAIPQGNIPSSLRSSVAPTEIVMKFSMPTLLYSQLVFNMKASLPSPSHNPGNAPIYSIINGTSGGMVYTYLADKSAGLTELAGYKGIYVVSFSYAGNNVINETQLAGTISGDLP